MNDDKVAVAPLRIICFWCSDWTLHRKFRFDFPFPDSTLLNPDGVLWESRLTGELDNFDNQAKIVICNVLHSNLTKRGARA